MAQESPAQPREVKTRARSLLAGLPLIFEPNQGQGHLDPADRRAKFVTRGSGIQPVSGLRRRDPEPVSQDPSQSPAAGKHEASHARVSSLQMKLAGANPNASLTGADLLPGKSNYFLGNDPAKWRRGVPQFARVRYENIYPGINLVFYGNQGRLEYDFQVEPGSDPAQAELEFNGAKQLELKDGALVIRSEGGSVRLRGSARVSGDRRASSNRWKAASFCGARSAPDSRLDPTTTRANWSSIRSCISRPISAAAGTSARPPLRSMAAFNIYLTGRQHPQSADHRRRQFRRRCSGRDQNVYIAKITPPLGSIAAALDYVTYLGGDGTDSPVGISVDGAGNPYRSGHNFVRQLSDDPAQRLSERYPKLEHRHSTYS